MRFDRRQFIRLGAAGALFATGCGKGSNQANQNPQPNQTQGAGPGSGAELQVDFSGLYIIEGRGAATRIHMIEGSMVGVTTHLAQMKANAAMIDQTKTTKPDAQHIKQIGADTFWYWDLKGVTGAMPGADSGSDVLTSDDSSGEDGLELPTSDAGWHSLVRVPDLKALMGATKVTNMAAVASTIALKHGHLAVLMPDGVGARAVWTFKKSDGTTLAQRAVSNKVRYVRSNSGNQLAIDLGTQKVYINKNVTTQVVITNIDQTAPACPAPCTPNMNHFTAFLQMVDKQFDSAATLASFTPKAGQNADPDYCPGSRVAP